MKAGKKNPTKNPDIWLTVDWGHLYKSHNHSCWSNMHHKAGGWLTMSYRLPFERQQDLRASTLSQLTKHHSQRQIKPSKLFFTTSFYREISIYEWNQFWAKRKKNVVKHLKLLNVCWSGKCKCHDGLYIPSIWPWHITCKRSLWRCNALELCP